MVLLVMKQLESVLCGPKHIGESKRGMAVLSSQTSVTLAIALAKLHMPIPHELHLILLRSISSNLGNDVRHYINLSIFCSMKLIHIFLFR